MLLTSVVLAGGALAVGGKVYVERQREKKTPWTVAARKMAEKRKKRPGFRLVPQAIINTAEHVVQQSEETAAELAVEVGYIQRYWRPYWRQGALAVGFLLSSQGVQMVGAYLLKTVVDGVTATQALNPLMLPLLGGAFLVGYPVGVWLNLKGEELSARLNSYIANDLRADLFTHLQTLSPAFFKESQPGDVSSRFVSEISQIIDAIGTPFIWGISAFATLMVTFPQLFLIDWRLAMLVFGPLPVAILFASYLGPRAIRASYQYKQSEGAVNNFVQESIHVQPLIYSFEAQENVGGRFDERLEPLIEGQYQTSWKFAQLRVSGAQFLFLCQVLATAGGGLLVVNQMMSAGSLVAFLALLNISTSRFSRVIEWQIPMMVKAGGAARRLEEIFAQKPTVVDAPDAYPLPPFREAIRFEGVSFSYNEQQTHLEDINFTIKAGQHVAIVGPNGAGKSTILSLLMRFYDSKAGTITFDGQDIRDVTQSSLRSQMSIVFQEPLLFDATIAQNIQISKPDASHDEIVAATQEAQIHDFIIGLPAGYQTAIGEGGGKLSRGQKQKIAIARALLRNPRILILDEVTNGLDANAREAMQQTINAIVGGRTVITITHHTTQLQGVDQIIRLKAGRLVE